VFSRIRQQQKATEWAALLAGKASAKRAKGMRYARG